MTKEQVLDEYFLDARSKLLDIAAFIDRIERSNGAEDFRWHSFTACLPLLNDRETGKVRRILELLSDPTTEPVETAPGKGATGAWPDFKAAK